ncbi:TlpA disulfide reductase family protein [Sulfitobacter sp. F26204]|uniref:TlpA family protein disulfide reductase n=1 Tax=Sulfitobacter sp. F26204 TaxID=2996014 RepID=UPI00225E1E65|nr:TlpA disulfide reductase family protein [Sulfitobacter sp. F26204]MCX7561012.1 TlpA disulfide reductase family protein [Sulfitobacter sp. F26204]
MRNLVFGLLYTALLTGANAALSAGPDILSLRTGDMKKLIVHDSPQAVSDSAFDLADDAGTATLAEYRDKYVLVNFWATWCAPCRKEMPQLNALQKEFGGEDFEVLTIATGRNSPAGITKFFSEAGIDSLPRHQDPKQQLASQMGIFGLPISVLIDPEGREIARLRGDAKWDSDSAKAIVKALIKSRVEK